MTKILVVDDDPQLRQSFERLLLREGYETLTAPSAEEGIKKVTSFKPDLIIMDVRMSGMTGLEAFKIIKEIDAKIPVIIMTAYGTTDSAIEATKLGAFDYILKPFDIPDVLSLIDKAIKAGHFMKAQVKLGDKDDNDAYDNIETDAIIGNSPVMQEVYKAIGRAAPTDATVLIRGESGTGKELVARAIYQHSLRSDHAFQIINCVAIPETLLESELFGYEKGAFTGAVNRRIGKIEQANHGTVFLDEIGDMPLNIQSKILRLLQERSIERLGGRSPIPVDVRIIAATNVDLEKAVEDGRFREDLYYRLKVVNLELPPIRKRKQDIPLLANYFLAQYAREIDSEIPELTTESIETLKAYNWPGNVRELANSMHKLLIFNRGYALTSDDIQEAIGAQVVSKKTDEKEKDLAPESFEKHLRLWIREMLTESYGKCYDELMDKIAYIIISEALEQTRGNRSQAAKMLGFSRPTLLAKIEKFQMTIHTSVT
ncbi:sigma-54-dependent transcriptional regulator [Desulforegula conservatrix]|uniref:sigma-54-dependent transcriptional regulator n=1 Tax=Desulforegula conservatrix TaxID=153026 RepID=UPI0003F87361|nr:sigma-54 dependent transcriptional regulator [Desulforegula conservatrix]